MTFTTTVKVRFYELDPYNHVNHAAYIQYFEVARVELLESLGLGLAKLAELGFQLVVTDLNIRYVASAGSGDELTIDTDVAELRRVSSRWRQVMRRGDDVMATQEIGVATLGPDGRPCLLPAALSEALAPLLDA